MGTKQFIGYHGTCSENIVKIKENNFKPSDWGWTGPGVYFFENNNELAAEWAEYSYPDKEICVLERLINVDDNKILDISTPNTGHNIKIQETRKRFLEKAIKEGRKIKDSDEKIDSKIINMVATIGRFDVVRNFTYTYIPADRALGKERKRKPLRSNVPNGIELCVRNLKCIHHKK